MDNNTLWSLRLGFSSREAAKIKKDGIGRFVRSSFAPSPVATPAFIEALPKTVLEIRTANRMAEDREAKRAAKMERNDTILELKAWWIDRMRSQEFPLREKMTLFWHNHYVASFNKVSVNYWLYTHNKLLRENAFGNFRELTKKMLQTNIMVRYLDNNTNVKGNFNENLSRELLELFTLGIGNYTEQDIKNGAKGLAGLTVGDENAVYKPSKENEEPFTYFGKKGNFKADEMVDIIFQQKSAPYFITRKILKWFIYDNPPEKLVTYYGDYLREKDFEMEPFLLRMFTEEFAKSTQGSKIKDPMLFILQLLHEFKAKPINSRMVAHFTRLQGMDLFNHPNVKGWNGGNYWLSTQIYQQRHNLADLLCTKVTNARRVKIFAQEGNEALEKMAVKPDWDRSGNNKAIIAGLSGRLLFNVDADLQADFENMLRHDFNPRAEGAENGVMRLLNFMLKTPEFQLI
ncbi:DUF1800 domain-containing protein [uncultured Flavobacterium sp.]|uniref:DUF1800 domain-containing protein n=1 Tax=uncultured Flavobacterium sp. TaxID=165435 RepID=UPI0025CD01C1|nr:DUF1800 domain-containing protein [uncultured Flavobacterium sp.]